MLTCDSMQQTEQPFSGRNTTLFYWANSGISDDKIFYAKNKEPIYWLTSQVNSVNPVLT